MSGQMPTASEVLHDEEIMRIHELWQQTKAELKLKARELAELEHARALEGEQLQAEHANGMREMQAICVELRDKNRGLETQLQGAHDEIRRLSGLLEESNRKAREAHGRVEQQAALASSGEQQVRELHQSLRALERDRKEVIDRSYADVRRLEEQLAQKDQAIAALEAQARNATQSVRAARDEHAGEVERAREQQRRLEDADASNRELSKQLGATREQLKYLQLARRNEAQLHAVVQQLQADNARLVKVLAATDEFRDFVEYADDSGGLSYVTPAAGGAGALARAESVVADDMPVRGARREGALWVPSDAFTLANEFRHTHAPHVGSDVFADLLLKLNAVWRQREQRALARLRQRHADERQRLLRRSKNREPYTTIVQAAEVERLKRELRVVRLGVGSGRRRLNETEERLLESSLAAVESLSAQLAALKDKDAMQRQESMGPDAPGAPSGAYADGAAAASSKAADMVDVLGDKIGALVHDFQRRTTEVRRDEADVYITLLKLQAWFFESLERRVHACRDRVRSLAHELQPALDAAEGMTPFRGGYGRSGLSDDEHEEEERRRLFDYDDE